MKSFKQYEISESALTDTDLEVLPTKVKMDKDGTVKSYSLDIVADDGKKKKSVKDSSLEKAINNFLGDADIKSEIARNPKGMLFNIEVYQDEKGFYIELGSKKVYFKM